MFAPFGDAHRWGYPSAGYARFARSPAVKYGWPAPRTSCRRNPGRVLRWQTSSGVNTRKWDIPSAGYGMVDLLRGLNPGRILRRPLFISRFFAFGFAESAPARQRKQAFFALTYSQTSLFTHLVSPFFTFHFSFFTSTAARLSA